jgi:potassium efflux system protein
MRRGRLAPGAAGSCAGCAPSTSSSFRALLLFTYRAIGWYASNDWPSGLIEGMLPIFWLLFVYRLLVQLVLKALPKDQSERFATELLRPIVLILILLIARNLLFSTLGLGEISLLRLGDIVLNLGALLDGMIVILAAFLVGGAVRKALLNMMIRGEMEADVANTVSNVVRYSIVGLGVLVAIGILGIELSALGWIAGGLVVGLGFGLQELFANFVSGIVLVFERIVRPGDVIELDGIRGSVTKVLLRATVLQTPDSAEIVVPNKELMTRSVLALTYSDRITRVRLDISVAFDSDLPLVEQVLLTTIQSHPLILETPQPRAWITALDPHSVQVLAFGYVADFSQLFQVRSDLHQMVRDAFVIHGIVVPYPRQDVRVFAGDRERGVERDLVF